MIGVVDKGRAVDVSYLDFRRAFYSVAHNNLIDTLLTYGLDKTVR